MLGKKGKVFVLAGMIALLVLTGVLNIVLNMSADKVSGETFTKSDYFADFRSEREVDRKEYLLACEAIIKDPSSSEEAVLRAEEDRQFYVNAKNIETTLEHVLIAVGFEDVVVTATTENINIIVKTPELTSELVGRVREIVTAETGKLAKNMRVYRVS